MTCAHVLGLIDAGPFADYPSAHLAAAWEHARNCVICGPALQAAKAITAELSALPRPVPPSDLAGSVMARIARIPEPVAADATAPLRTASARARDPWAWAPAASVLAAALAIVLLVKSGDAGGAGFWSIREPTLTSLLAMPEPTGGTLALVVCLLVYATALFAPIRDSRRAPF